MSSVAEIEQAVRRLPPEQLSAFRRWLDEFADEQAEDAFDRKIAATAHRLRPLMAEAVAEHRSGQTLPLDPDTL